MPTVFEAASKKKKSMASDKNPVVTQRTSMGPLTCFAVNPTGVSFETQEEEETVILFLRPHIIVNVPWVVLAVVFVLAPTVLFPLFFRFVHLPVAIPVGYIVVGTVFWYVATFGFALAKFISWFFNIFIVSNQRVIDIDFLYLLHKSIAQAELSKIQDISYTTSGIFGTVFNYGSVVIETAGEAPNIEFELVPYPDRVVETIRSLVESTGRPL